MSTMNILDPPQYLYKKNLTKSRQHIDTRPKLNNGANGLVELKNIKWFADKRLCTEFVAFQNIRLAVRCREHDDRYFFKQRIFVHQTQDINTANTWHI